MTPAETKILQKILDLGHRIERACNAGNLEKFGKELSQFQALLMGFEHAEASDLKKIKEIADHLHPGMTLKSFLDFLVPIERALGKTVQDGDFLILSEDKTPTSGVSRIPLYIILDNIRSAFNVGSIFRAAECVGATEILLCGYTATPEDPSVKKTALGTQDWIKFQSFRKTQEALDYVKSLGAMVIGLETSNKSKDLFRMKLNQPIAFLLGNERFGLDAHLLNSCDEIAAVPMFGNKNSLNVANVTAIALFEARRQWSAQ